MRSSRSVGRTGRTRVVGRLATVVAGWLAAGCTVSAPAWRDAPASVEAVSRDGVQSRRAMRPPPDAGTPAGAPVATARVRRHAYPHPPHEHARAFVNLDSTPDIGFGALARWQAGRVAGGGRGAWDDWRDVQPALPAERVRAGAVVTWVNHATVLVQVDGLNLLLDPIWSDRASPVRFAGPDRHHAPGIAFDALPRIDAVLVSHNHYDHLDLPTLRRLSERDRPLVVAGLGNASMLAREGIGRAVDVDWGDVVALRGAGDEAAPEVQLVFLPARHGSARGLRDDRQTLWGAFAILAPSARVYFGGDTGYGRHFADAAARLGRFDLALLPIGAYRPRAILAGHHMDPADAIRAAEDLGAATTVPIHHSTFAMADDGQDEPVQALRDALRARGRPSPRFLVLAPGDAWVRAPATPPRRLPH